MAVIYSHLQSKSPERKVKKLVKYLFLFELLKRMPFLCDPCVSLILYPCVYTSKQAGYDHDEP